MDTSPPPSPASGSTTTPLPPRGGWWRRNWKWSVPLGCFTLLVLGFLVFITLLVGTVFGVVRSTDVYRTATARAKANPEVKAALGTPIAEGWFPTGNTNVNNGVGDANLSIPISGPKGKGTIYAVATKAGGTWRYSKLEVEVPKRDARIDLTSSASSR